MKIAIKLFLLIFLLSSVKTFSQDIPVKITPVGKDKLSKIYGPVQQSPDNNFFNVMPGNNSTSANARAPQGSRRFVNTKYIISGSEMTNSGFNGTVRSIGWRYNVPMPPAAAPPVSQTTNTVGRLVVYLKDTLASATTFSGTFIDTNGTGYTKIIEGTISLPTGTDEINVDVPVGGPGTSLFTPIPGNGCIVIFCYTTIGTLPTGNITCFTTNAPASSLLTYQSNTVNGTTGSTSAFRPETRFGNVTMGGTNDVGPLINVEPVGTVSITNPTTFAPKTKIENFGTAAQGPFNVNCTITGPTAYSNTKSISLNPSITTQVVFDSTFTPALGNYSMKITTQLAGDGQPVNDTLTTFFTISNANYGGGTLSHGGYFFSNSILGTGAPNQPTYNWIDPVAAGHTVATFLPDFDDGLTSVDLGFNFTYMGTTFNTGLPNLNIYTNGFLNFGTAVAPQVYNASAFPSPLNAPNMVAPGLIDLDFTQPTYPNAKVYYGGDATQFVVTYFHSEFFGSATDYLTMQVIFYPNGNIKFQYNDAESFNHLVTFAPVCDIGIQNLLGTAGVQYRIEGVGGPMFSSPLAVEFGLNQNVLPVELSSFSSSLNGRNVNLNWSTASETNNSGYDVERKIEGSAWTKIGSVAGAGTSNTSHSYNFSDRNLSTGKYNYRLKQIDNNGNFRYYELSNEVIIGVPSKFELSQNFPNPFNPTTNINYDLPFDSKVSLKVFDLSGKEVASLVNGVQTAGSYTLNFNASSLSSGVYFYQINVTGGTQNFAKTMKMLLVK